MPDNTQAQTPAEKLIYSPEFIPFYPKIAQDYKLNALETLLYGFIRFYLSSSSNSFYFTNDDLAKLLTTNKQVTDFTISRAFKTLIDKGLIEVNYKIKANGGKLRFVKYNSDLRKTSIPNCGKHQSNNNKIKDNNNYINITEQSSELPKKPVRKQRDPSVDKVIQYLKEKLELPVLDNTILKNRRYAYLLLQKYKGLEPVLKIIDVTAETKFWRGQVTSTITLYYKAMQILSSKREESSNNYGKSFIATD